MTIHGFSRKAVLIGTTGIVALALAVVLRGAGVFGGGSNSSPHRLLLLSQAGEVPQLDDQAAKSARFTVTHSPGDLTRNVDEATRAIVLTKATAGQVDPVWLRGQYESGVVIAAINVPSRDLKALVGDTSGGAVPFSDPSVPFFSSVRTTACFNQHSASSVSHASIDLLVENLELDISENENPCPQASPHE